MSEAIEVRKRLSIKRVALASLIGTSIEWYDFFLYGTAAALVFNKLFFPNLDPLVGQLAAFATFWVAFIGRPVGGIFFGHFGDRVGRKNILILTLLIMGASTFLIGCLPIYNAIGVFAPLLLLILRFFQGFAVGGEWGGAVLLVTEYAPVGKRGFFGSWPQMGVPIGLILSSLLFSFTSTYLSNSQFLNIGWRIPFLLSILLVFSGLLIRLKIAETPDFEQVKKQNVIVKVPLFQVLRKDMKNVLLAGGVLFLPSGGFYIFVTFIISYGTKVLKMSGATFLNATLIGAIALFITLPLAGILSDRFGRRTLCLAGAIFTTVMTFPIFWLIDSKSAILITLALCLLHVGLGLIYGPLAAFFTELFGANVRYSGASLGYQAVSVLAGGLAPFIATALLSVDHNASWPIAIYVIVMALISIVSSYLAPEARSAATIEAVMVESLVERS